VHDRYIEFAKRTCRAMSLNGLRIVVDCANGAAYKVAPAGAVGTRRRRHRSATSRTASTSTRNAARRIPAALQKKVHEVRADIGIALDGDADRVIIVDEKGKSSTATRSWR
jgi:phosphoglucosamine mutase